MSDQSLVGQIVEIWFLYVIGAVMIGARIFCRTKLVGFANYQLDDYIIVGVACMWTAAPGIGQVFVQVAEGRHTSDLTYDERKNMSDEDRAKWTYGSQMFLFGLTGYFFIVWMLKFNMLCFYSRVVRRMWTEKFVKPAMAVVILSAVVIVLTIALTCRPFQHYWQVWPDPGPQCVPQNFTVFVVILSFNLFTDVCIMLIPLPVLIGLKIKLWKRIGVYFLFALGFFCMFAAILRFVLIFNLNQRGVSAMWSLREDCVAIFVGQAPLVTPLLRRKFWEEGGYVTSRTGKSTSRSRNDGYYQHRGDNERSGTHVSAGKPSELYPMTTIGGSESQEEIVGKNTPPVPSGRPVNGITVHSSIEIEEGPRQAQFDRDTRW
ncbi:unnamed protein product [Clonostachys byssicola]|uniref:Rhodopsin domain-containing protein n=1 Tax=Clonostachys byssicola TaxID=160290 RepID=A0A9N9Y5K0_9HYPO|nr:unnamed protein product [Clonostachys byssicola]